MPSTVPTLTIPEMGTFSFQRSLETAIYGEGNWLPMGRQYKSYQPGTILPRDIQDELTVLARARGIPEDHNYRRSLPKPERKPVSVGGTRKGKTEKPSDGVLRGSFNPFAAR